jgi:hypothetical protein
MAIALQQLMKQVQEAVYKNGYYIPAYEATLIENNLTKEGIENLSYTDKQVVELAHYFWDILPDSGSIRRPPFNTLCEIAEYIFNDFDQKGKLIS